MNLISITEVNVLMFVQSHHIDDQNVSDNSREDQQAEEDGIYSENLRHVYTSHLSVCSVHLESGLMTVVSAH